MTFDPESGGSSIPNSPLERPLSVLRIPIRPPPSSRIGVGVGQDEEFGGLGEHLAGEDEAGVGFPADRVAVVEEGGEVLRLVRAVAVHGDHDGRLDLGDDFHQVLENRVGCGSPRRHGVLRPEGLRHS